MKCYFTLTDGIKNDEKNMNMLRLSLKTAKENTSLDLYALYDGSKDDNVYKTFQEFGVNVIFCKCSFEDNLERYYKNWEFDGTLLNSLKRMLGCFMKFDIALYEKEDEVILYSDIDTIFNKDTDWHKFNNVKTIAVAPEFRQNFDIIKGNKYFSAGIMFINIPELKKRRDILLNMLDNNIKPYQECWDQGFFNELYKNDFELMPLEFNWKPYWGINNEAVIVHVHGWKMGHELKKENFDFCKDVLGLYPQSADGILFYNLMGYRILGLDKDMYIVKLAKYLTLAKIRSDTSPRKCFKIASLILYGLYRITNRRKLKLFKNINLYAKKNLVKRGIIRDANIELDMICKS